MCVLFIQFIFSLSIHFMRELIQYISFIISFVKMWIINSHHRFNLKLFGTFVLTSVLIFTPTHQTIKWTRQHMFKSPNAILAGMIWFNKWKNYFYLSTKLPSISLKWGTYILFKTNIFVFQLKMITWWMKHVLAW